MADLFSVKIDDESLKAFGRRFRRAKLKQVDIALGEIRREWQADFVRQQRQYASGGTWAPLSPAYRERKERERGDPRFPEVRFVSLLKRGGAMLDGYINGITIDPTNYTVTIPFPTGSLGVRARAHQGVSGRPVNMPARPFHTDRFARLANRILRDALAKK
jgi:hypothetical protein